LGANKSEEVIIWYGRKSHNKSLMEGSDKTSGGLLLTTLCDNTTKETEEEELA